LLTVTVACAPEEVTSETAPLAAPETLTPPIAPTTTTAVVVTATAEKRNSLYLIDPLTLDPIEGAETMRLGDWVWGMSSPNGAWLALRVGNDNNTNEEMHLIDVAGWKDVASWSPAAEELLAVGDDGSIYTMVGAGGSVSRWTVEGVGPEREVDLPSNFYPRQRAHFDERKVYLFGGISDSSGETRLAAILVAELESGAGTTIELPDVEVGVIQTVDIGEDFFPSLYASPTVVWDVDMERALVVHADVDIVTEVDMATGGIVEHSYGAEASLVGRLFAWLAPPANAKGGYGETRRSAVLSGDESTLFVATSIGNIQMSDDDWSVTTVSSGIVAIDTGSWEVIDRLDAPISDIALSPDGARMIGYGGEMRESPSDSGYESRGYYVIDAEDLEVVSSHRTDDPYSSFSTVAFGSTGKVGYVGYYDFYGQMSIDIVALEDGTVVGTVTGTDLQLFSRAGVLGVTE